MRRDSVISVLQSPPASQPKAAVRSLLSQISRKMRDASSKPKATTSPRPQALSAATRQSASTSSAAS